MELQIIQNKIHELRGMKVMLDYDLAELYEVLTKNLNLAVKRNISRFPDDFRFQLTKEEYAFLRLQSATLETGTGKHSKYLPYAFTEQGVAMLSGVLTSAKAVAVNIAIMRTFIKMRQYSLNYKDLADKLQEHDMQFKDVYQAVGLSHP